MASKTSNGFKGLYSGNTVPNQTVAQLLLEYLKLEGVEKVFGVPGGAVIFITDELKKRKDEFDFLICRHETGAAYIADGYYRVTGNLGVVLTTAGPSAINALTGAMNAEAGNSSVLTITGEVPEKFFGQAYLQEGVDAHLNVNTAFRNAVQYSTMIVSPSSFQTLFQQAMRESRSLPARAAHISIPNDIAGTCVVGNEPGKTHSIPFPTSPENYRATPNSVDAAQMQQTFDALTSATKPLIFLGNGARHALRDDARLRGFAELVERLAIPVMTTPDGKGIFPESHAISLRNYGMTPCAWPQAYMLEQDDPDHFDALAVIGSGLGELASSPSAMKHYDKALIPSGHMTQVDLDHTIIGRSFPVNQGIVGEAGAAIDCLIRSGADCSPSGDEQQKIESRRELIEEIKKATPFEFPEEREGNAHPLHPAAAMRVINEAVTDGHIFIDAGNCGAWALNNLVINPPNQYHIALGMGPMGFAVGAVVGGKIGAPDKDCVAIVGDGAFMMQGSEISTAAQNRVGAVWIVLYDNDLSMVSQGMGALFPPKESWDDYYELGAPDLVKYSEGLGADAVAIKEGPEEMKVELEATLQRAKVHSKPQVLVLHIDTKAMPKYGWPTLKETTCT